MAEGYSVEPTEGTPETKGVVLFAFGKRAYLEATYNLCYTMRKHGFVGNVTLYTDDTEQANAILKDLTPEVKVQRLNEKYYKEGKKIDPAYLKLSMYELLPYDANLYLDVDSICLKDIGSLIDSLCNLGGEFYTLKAGIYTPEQGEKWADMVWAKVKDFKEQFGISEQPLYAINSSLMFVRKGSVSKDIFKTTKKLYQKNQFPLNKLQFKWGGGQPDELYFNGALSKLEYNPFIDGSRTGELVFFSTKVKETISEIKAKYYIFSYYGGKVIRITFT
jgi:hypothetical protein